MRTTPQELTLERLRALLDAYGAEVARFPEAEREAARALLARSDQARALLEEARALDGLLALAPRAKLAPALLRALETIPERHQQESPIRQLLPARRRVWVALAAAAALVLGVVSGMDGVATQEVALTQAELDAEERALSELSALALGQELVSDLGNLEGEAQ